MKVQLLLVISTIATVAATANYATRHREYRPSVEEANGTAGVKTPRFIKVSRTRNVRLDDSEEDVLPVVATNPPNRAKMRHYAQPVDIKDTKATNINTRKDATQTRSSHSRTQNSRSIPNRIYADTTPSRSDDIITERQTRRKSPYRLMLTDPKEEQPTAPTTTPATNPPLPTMAATRTSTTPRPNFWDNFMFTLFPMNFWNFVNQHQPVETTTTPVTSNITRKPPKKFVPPAPTATAKEEKSNYRKALKSNAKHAKISATTTTTTPHSMVEGPFRIALPTLNLPSAVSEKEKEKRATSVAQLRQLYNCPIESEVRFQLFPKICKEDKDCSIWNRDELCCDIFGAKSCVSGIPKPLEEAAHSPIFGLIPRKCPTRPLAELWWDVKECNSDMDCWPRVCCPDGRRRYCRTSQPELETAPVQVKRSFNYLTEYLECTPPPPPIFDLHPKACTSTLDCFPNVCCQEAGLRHCRPPKKSVLTLMANFLNVDFVKRLAQNIVIK